MTKIQNFALKIKGSGREGGTSVVLRPCHPPKISTAASCCLMVTSHLSVKRERPLIITHYFYFKHIMKLIVT